MAILEVVVMPYIGVCGGAICLVFNSSLVYHFQESHILETGHIVRNTSSYKQ